MLLAIDTATRTESVALFDETGVIGETTWRAHENHTTSLMPQLLRLMNLGGVKLEDLRAVGVATGPGSFTGLRIGLSVAKGLAYGRGLPLVGIPTLDGEAQAFAQQPLPVWAVLEAGRGRYAAAPYLIRRERVKREGDYVVGTAEQIAASILARLGGEASLKMREEQVSFALTPRVLVCGEIDGALRSTLLSRLWGLAIVAHPASSARRASFLAELAWARWQTNEIDDVEKLAPYYIPTASLPQNVP